MSNACHSTLHVMQNDDSEIVIVFKCSLWLVDCHRLPAVVDSS